MLKVYKRMIVSGCLLLAYTYIPQANSQPHGTCWSNTSVPITLAFDQSNPAYKGYTVPEKTFRPSSDAFSVDCALTQQDLDSWTQYKAGLKAAYVDSTLKPDGEGFVNLNEYISVKTRIYVYNNKYPTVPFSDITNDWKSYPADFIKKNSWYTGSYIYVSAKIKKSSLTGNITIPDFKIALYARINGLATEWATQPALIIDFRQTILKFPPACKINNRLSGNNDALTTKIVTSNADFDVGNLAISCDSRTSDIINFKVAFPGKSLYENEKYFSTSLKGFGMGVIDVNTGKLIPPGSDITVDRKGLSSISVPLRLSPELNNKDIPYNNNQVDFNLTPIIKE